MKKLISLISILFLLSPFALAGCSTPPDKISATYVSPLEYDDFTCKQIRGEMSRVSRKVNEVSGAQQKEADGDSAAMGIGLVVFWPALFFLAGDDKKEELAMLKGQYDALEQSAIKKNCDVAKQIKEAQALEEKRQAARAEKNKRTDVKPND